jgi:hypothetical protein
MSKERMAAAADEADEFLDSLTAPPEEEAPVGGIVPEEGHQPDDTPAPDKAPEASIDTLTAEVNRLKAQLGDENNPSWKAKYHTLQGMFNRLNGEIKELKEQGKKVEPSAPDVPKVDEKLIKRLTDSFGEEDVEAISQLIEQRAQQIAAQSLSDQLKPYDERIDKVEQSQVQTKEQGFFGALASAVPDWKQINGWEPDGIGQQPQFAQFLDQTVPATDYTYNDLLQHHYQNGNAAKTAEIFNIYKATQGTPQPEKPKAKGVEQYVDPGKTQKGTAPPDPNQQKTYSLTDIDRFYDSVTKGTFRGTYDERVALEKEYHQAIIEGRVK